MTDADTLASLREEYAALVAAKNAVVREAHQYLLRAVAAEARVAELEQLAIAYRFGIAQLTD